MPEWSGPALQPLPNPADAMIDAANKASFDDVWAVNSRRDWTRAGNFQTPSEVRDRQRECTPSTERLSTPAGLTPRLDARA